jgi:hypothetical protein
MGGEKSRDGKRALALGCGGLFAVLVAAAGSYLAWANWPLPPPDPPWALPSPNGFDACRQPIREAVDVWQRWRGRWGAWKVPERPLPAETGRCLDAVRRALELEFVHPPPAPRWSAAGGFPVDACFYVAQLFVGESRGALSAGRTVPAVRSALDAIELGSRIGHGGTDYAHRVGLLCAARGITQVERCIPRLTEREARDAGRRLDRLIAQFPPLADALRTERRIALQETRRMLRPPGIGDRLVRQHRRLFRQAFHREPGQKIRTALGIVYPKRAVYAAVDTYFQRLIGEARKPYVQRARLRPPTWPGAGSGFVLDPDGQLHAVYEAKLRLLRLELALQESYRRHHRYPATLSGLAPGVSVDPFTGRSLVYRLRGKRYLLYSAGPDGADHGGGSDLVAGRL